MYKSEPRKALHDNTLGSNVSVAPDLSPGMCLTGGNGFVVDFNGDSILGMFTLMLYDNCGPIGGITESKTCYSCHTVLVTCPFAWRKLV
jgi:hypothetical protein